MLQSWIKQKTIQLIMLLISISVFYAPSASAESAIEFYYFNPDSFQSNLDQLKKEVSRFLIAAELPISFQPFAKLRDFEREIQKKSPGFLFIPDWYLQIHRRELGLQPLLKPLRNGSNTYTKILLVPEHSNLTLINLVKKTVAMTPMGPNSEQLLADILLQQPLIATDSWRVINTPKDYDALMALALRQVDAAFVTDDNWNKIGGINPHIKKSLQPVAESLPITMPSLCSISGSVSKMQQDKLVHALRNTTRESVQFMEMLHIDTWKTYTD